MILRDIDYSSALTCTVVVIADAVLRSGSVRVRLLRVSLSGEANHGWIESSISQRSGYEATTWMLLPVPAQQVLHNVRQRVSSRWYGRTLAGRDHRNSPSLLSKKADFGDLGLQQTKERQRLWKIECHIIRL